MIAGRITHRDFIKLSDRLMMSAKMVTEGSVVADIGCDHAHTDIWLVKEGIAKRTIAMDVGEGPLSHASENIRLYGLEAMIETRLSYGLDGLKPGEADSVVIAGMGGTLTTCILNKGKSVLNTVKELILQPQSDIWMVRRFLREHGFIITDEEMCLEDGKFYNSMRAVLDNRADGDINTVRPSGKSLGESQKDGIQLWTQDFVCRDMDLSEDNELLVYDMFGELLISRRNPVLSELLENLINKNNRVLEGIRSMGGGSSENKRRYFEKEKVLLELALQKIK